MARPRVWWSYRWGFSRKSASCVWCLLKKWERNEQLLKFCGFCFVFCHSMLQFHFRRLCVREHKSKLHISVMSTFCTTNSSVRTFTQLRLCGACCVGTGSDVVADYFSVNFQQYQFNFTILRWTIFFYAIIITLNCLKLIIKWKNSQNFESLTNLNVVYECHYEMKRTSNMAKQNDIRFASASVYCWQDSHLLLVLPDVRNMKRTYDEKFRWQSFINFL